MVAVGAIGKTFVFLGKHFKHIKRAAPVISALISGATAVNYVRKKYQTGRGFMSFGIGSRDYESKAKQHMDKPFYGVFESYNVNEPRSEENLNRAFRNQYDRYGSWGDYDWDTETFEYSLSRRQAIHDGIGSLDDEALTFNDSYKKSMLKNMYQDAKRYYKYFKNHGNTETKINNILDTIEDMFF